MTKKKGDSYWVILDVRSEQEPKVLKRGVSKLTGISADCIGVFKRMDKKR